MKRFFKMLIFLMVMPLYSQVLVITHAFNRPDFIPYQYFTFKKFLKDDYKFVVFNDARDMHHKKSIEDVCNMLGIDCIRIPQAVHDRPYLKRWPGEDYNHSVVRCANVVQYSLDVLGFDHNGIVMIIDSDMFLVKPFSLESFMTDNKIDIAGVYQGRQGIKYLWNGIVFMNMNTLPNRRTLDWNCGKVEGVSVDVGGQTHYYLKYNPHINVHYIQQIHSDGLICNMCRERHNAKCSHNDEILMKYNITDEKTVKFLKAGPVNIEFFHNESFLHYRGAGWDHKTPHYHQVKTKLVDEYIKDLLKD
jgi:hypothetical protein